MRNIVKNLIFICFLCSQSNASKLVAIQFPDTKLTKIGDPCQHHTGIKGNCQLLYNCRDVFESIRSLEVDFLQVRCPESKDGYNLVCCRPADTLNAVIDLSPPVIDFVCGFPWIAGQTDLKKLYGGNRTAEEFERKGYEIKILDMYYDSIREFEYTKNNETRSHFHAIFFAAIGGENARKLLSSFMALMGDGNRWLCDGVLIHPEWILTAAHCFDDVPISVLRLGEYDFGSDADTITEYPIDFTIEKVVFHPDYKFPSAHHDLALVKIKEPIPQLRLQTDITPICLPWGEESLLDLIGQEVTLVGWGAKAFLGPNSPILQEVNVTVFDPAVCDASYSQLPDYGDRFPSGLNRNTAICAGALEGGKDACQGDSGGPILYRKDDGQMVLAGVVSTGNGCGLKEFPGIYIPLHNPFYLAWIKKVAFLGN